MVDEVDAAATVHTHAEMDAEFKGDVVRNLDLSRSAPHTTSPSDSTTVYHTVMQHKATPLHSQPAMSCLTVHVFAGRMSITHRQCTNVLLTSVSQRFQETAGNAGR